MKKILYSGSSSLNRVGVFFVLCLAILPITAQESIAVSGTNASGSNGSASISVGQIFYSTYSGANGTVAQGIQQPHEISVLSGLEHAALIKLESYVYPNPTSDYLILKINDEEIAAYTFFLYNLKGELLLSDKIRENITSISMRGLSTSNYLLKIFKNKQEMTTYKILKK